MQPKKFLRWYLDTWAACTTTFAFYQNLPSRSLRSSVAFVLVSYTLLSLVQASIFAKQVVPELRQLIQTIPSVIEQQLAVESKLTWDGNELQLTPAQTVRFALPPKLLRANVPETAFFIGETTDEPAIVHVTPTTLLVQTSGQSQTLSLTEVLGPEQFSLSQVEVVEWLRQTSSGAERLIHTLQYFLPVFFLLNYGISRSLFLLVETMLLYVVLRVYRQPKHLVELSKVTLHVLVLAEVINQWAAIVLPQASVSILSLSFWVLLVVVLLQQQKHPNC